MGSKIKSAIACNLDRNILLAALPLFQSEEVEAIEWSFDALFKVKHIPDWFVDLLKEFSNSNRLIGHGVFFSIFSGRWSSEQEQWLKHLEKVSRNFKFEHVTEHFGFMTGENFHQGAPISVPFTEETLALGQDRLKRIANACACPVGLENLAFAYSLEEVKRHGDFLEQLVSPINGFIILDLHNLYCQMHNFDVSFENIIQCFPLDKVKEIHISGGSWDQSEINKNKKVRRDTHDESVPKEVFTLLEKTIIQCPNLDFVVIEQLGSGLKTEIQQTQFRIDFLKIKSIVSKSRTEKSINNQFEHFFHSDLEKPLQSEELHLDQMELSRILEHSNSVSQVRQKLTNSRLAKSAWGIENWDAVMIETVYKIAQKWKGGF